MIGFLEIICGVVLLLLLRLRTRIKDLEEEIESLHAKNNTLDDWLYGRFGEVP